MTEDEHCPECGTPLIGVSKCSEYFDRMIAWDFEDFKGVGQVHHLTVLSYYLQHPSHYSSMGLKQAVRILKRFIENNLTDKELYQVESDTFSSARRGWPVTGTSKDYGTYSQKINWTMTVAGVVKDGVTQYPVHVKQWSTSIFHDLKIVGETERPTVSS